MLMKKMFVAVAVIAVFGAAASAYAAFDAKAISLDAAVAAAEKAYPGEALRSTLRASPNGPVWEVCIEQQTGVRVHVLVDAQTGRIAAADARSAAPDAKASGYLCPYAPDGTSYGRGGHHRGVGFHHRW